MDAINDELGRTHVKDYYKSLEVEKYKRVILGSVHDPRIDRTAEILADKLMEEDYGPK